MITAQPNSFADSIDYYKKNIPYSEYEYEDFEGIMKRLETYTDIHSYVLKNLSTIIRTPILHDYQPAFLSFVCNNMDSIYQEAIIRKIYNNDILNFIAYPIVKGGLFENEVETCRFLNSLNLESNELKDAEFSLESSMWKLFNEKKCENYIESNTAQMILGYWRVVSQTRGNNKKYQLEKLSLSTFEKFDYTFFPNSKFERNYFDNHSKENQSRRKSFGTYTIESDTLLRLHYYDHPGFTTEFILKNLSSSKMELHLSKTIFE